MALQNMGDPGDGPITLRTTVFSGEADDTSFRVLEEVELKPGVFHQYNQVLKELGIPAQGYVKRVEPRSEGLCLPGTAHGFNLVAANLPLSKVALTDDPACRSVEAS